MADLAVSVILKAVDRMTAPIRSVNRSAALLGASVAKAAKPTIKLKESLAGAAISTSKLGASQQRVKTKINSTTSALRQQAVQLHKIKTLQNRLGRNLLKNQARIDRNLQKRGELRGKMLDTAVFGLAAFLPVKAAINFESTMADVKKVVNFDTPQQYKQMSADILKMSTVIPVAAKGLGDIVAQAGQAGIARKELLGFTMDAAKMGVAFDMPAKEAGAAMTGMRKIFHLNQVGVDSLGDSYNYLSNTMDAKASDIVAVGNRIGSLAVQAHLSGQQLAGLSATFKALKTPNEIAATAIKGLFQRVGTATRQGKRFKEGLKEIGMTAEGLEKSFNRNSQATIFKFLEAIHNSKDAKGLTVDFFGREISGTLTKLIDNTDTYHKAVDLATDSVKYAGSMNKEYSVRAKTTANNLQLLGNKVIRLGINLGSILLPSINSIAKVMGGLIDKLVTLAKKFPVVTKVVVGLTTALIAGKVAAIAFGYGWTFVKGGLLSSISAITRTRMALTLFNKELSTQRRLTVVSQVLGLSKAEAMNKRFSRSLIAGNFGVKKSYKKINASLFMLIKRAIPTFIAGMKAAGLATMNFGKQGIAVALSGLKLLRKGFVAAGIAAFTFAKNPIRGTGLGFKKLGNVMGRFGKLVTGVIIPGIRALGIAMLENPIGVLIAAVAAAAFLVYKFWGRIKAFVGGIIDGFVEGAKPILGAFKPLLPLFKYIGHAVSWVVGKIKSFFSASKASKEQLGAWSSAGKTFGKVLAKAFEIVLLPITTLISSIKWVIDNVGKLGKIANSVSKYTSGVWGSIKHSTSGAWGSVKQSTSRMLNNVFGSSKRVVGKTKGYGKVIPFPYGGRRGYTPPKNLAAGGHTVTRSTPKHLTAGGHTVIHNSPKYDIKINADGMNEKQLAHTLRRELDKRDRQAAANQRGALYDYGNAS